MVRFVALSTSECVERLRTGTIGRVGWNTVDGPQIMPVTYAWHDGQVVFRTSAYGPLAELHTGRAAVFEIDDFDLDTRTGWSVVVRGQARAAHGPEEVVTLWRDADPVPWAEGNRNLFLTIGTDVVTGRAVLQAQES